MNYNSVKIVDLQGVICPMNFVRAKAALAAIGSGEIAELVLDEGEALLNVPRSLIEEGHDILKVIPADKAYRVIVKKK